MFPRRQRHNNNVETSHQWIKETKKQLDPVLFQSTFSLNKPEISLKFAAADWISSEHKVWVCQVKRLCGSETGTETGSEEHCTPTTSWYHVAIDTKGFLGSFSPLECEHVCQPDKNTLKGFKFNLRFLRRSNYCGRLIISVIFQAKMPNIC